MSLEIKGKLDTDLKIFKMFGSRDAFFSKGFTKTFFRHYGIVPVESDKFIRFVRAGRTSSVLSKRRVIGIGSRSHVFGDIFIMVPQKQSSDTTSKCVKGHPKINVHEQCIDEKQYLAYQESSEAAVLPQK